MARLLPIAERVLSLCPFLSATLARPIGDGREREFSRFPHFVHSTKIPDANKWLFRPSLRPSHLDIQRLPPCKWHALTGRTLNRSRGRGLRSGVEGKEGFVVPTAYVLE